VLELVPSEIERLLIPLRVADEGELRSLDRRFRSCREPELLLQQQDGILLRAAGLTTEDSDTIHKAWDKLRRRRHRTPALEDR
jgi:hypothetical protein